MHLHVVRLGQQVICIQKGVTNNCCKNASRQMSRQVQFVYISARECAGLAYKPAEAIRSTSQKT